MKQLFMIAFFLLAACSGGQITPTSMAPTALPSAPIDFEFFAQYSPDREKLYIAIWFMDQSGTEVPFQGSLEIKGSGLIPGLGWGFNEEDFEFRTIEFPYGSEQHLAAIIVLSSEHWAWPPDNLFIQPQGMREKGVSL